MSKRDSFSGLKCIIKSLPSLSNREGSSFYALAKPGVRLMKILYLLREIFYAGQPFEISILSPKCGTILF